MKKIVVILFFMSLVNTMAMGSAGTAVLTVKTVKTKGKYSPHNVLAIWVVDHKKQFVKTLKVCAKKRKKYLKAWRKSSKNNAVDAVTSATLKSHSSHKVTWDCKDIKGKVVENGTYFICIEFTDKDAAGLVKTIPFKKGVQAVSVKLNDQKYFKKMKLTYTPAK